MIVLSIPRRPDASPEKKAVAASTHSSAATRNLLQVGRRILRTRPAPTPSSPAFAFPPNKTRYKCDQLLMPSRTAIRRAKVADAPEVARLLHDFNTEFGDPTPASRRSPGGPPGSSPRARSRCCWVAKDRTASR